MSICLLVFCLKLRNVAGATEMAQLTKPEITGLRLQEPCLEAVGTSSENGGRLAYVPELAGLFRPRFSQVDTLEISQGSLASLLSSGQWLCLESGVATLSPVRVLRRTSLTSFVLECYTAQIPLLWLLMAMSRHLALQSFFT